MTKVSNISILPDATQNFVEVYKRRRVQRKFGTLEKQLIGVTVVLAILFILFFLLFLLSEYYYHQLAKEKLCTSRECLESATTLFQTVDFTQDPCEDFYKFACGKFGVEHPIPENYIQNSWFVEREDRLGSQILNVLTKPVSDLDLKPVRQTKEFYQSCVNRSELNSMGLKPLFKILEMLELPSNIPSNRTIENFNLARTLALAQRHLSQDILVSLSLSKGIENATVPNPQNSTILRISPGVNNINIFDVWKTNYGVFSERKFFKFRRKTDEEENGRNPASGDTKSSKQTVLATIRFIAGIIQQINNNLEVDEEMGDGYNTSHFVTTAYKIMTFTSQLVKDLDGNDTNAENNSTGVEQTTFSNLQTVLDAESKNPSVSNKIDWKEYLATLFENVNKTYDVDNEPVVVDNLEYFKHMSSILGEAKPETIQRHIWWKVIEQYAKHTTTEVRAIYNRYYQSLYGESAPPSRSYVCKTLMKDTMNVALSHEMSRIDNFATTSQKVLEMLEDIEKTFESLVMSITWMDSETKSVTLDKAKSVSKEVGYANWITDPSKINEYYVELELKKSEFLMNIARISEWEVGKVLKLIGPDTGNSSQKLGWYVNPLQVNAYYSREENTIIIPPGILQTPFYFRGLESLNYGAIGTILGHELTHGFDIDGKNYNKLGKRQENWWPDEIITQFVNKAKCFIDQYENYTLYNNTKLNGTLTLAENIADNGGIRESFKAYQLYVARHGQEPRLPGFENFTHEQLLFLSYANIWCEATGAKFYTLPQDSHSPHRVRVLASLQNMKEFSTAYNCSKKSFMNPANKCIIW